MEPIWEYTIKLIRFVLNGDVPELPEDIDFEQLFAFGKSHGVENMLYVGLRDLHIDVPEETMQKFKTAYEMQIMVEATQALELEAISEAFEEAGIDHVPLKGSVIKYLYPMPDYRKSGDIDILIRPEDEKEVKRILLNNGYTVDEHDDMEIHDGYRKPPFLLVEIHTKLVEKNNRSFEFLSHIWDNALPKKDTEHCCELDKETLYVFTVAHLCKHIKNSGAGIKFICDIWLLKKEINFNEQLLSKMLLEAKLSEFERMASELAEYWFGESSQCAEDTDVLQQFVLTSGCFGNKENHKAIRESDIDNNAFDVTVYRAKRIINNIFVPYSDMKRTYPILKKVCILLPVMWVVRVIDKALHEKSIREMAQTSIRIDIDGTKKYNKLWKAVN